MTTAWATNPSQAAIPDEQYWSTNPSPNTAKGGSWIERYVEKATPLHGVGTLAALVKPIEHTQSALTGQGQVSAATAAREFRTAGPAGAGTLYSSVYILTSRSAALGGQGQLYTPVGDGLHAVVRQQSTQTEHGAGQGTLGGLVTGIKVFITANLSGSGAVAAKLSIIPAALSGAGSLQAMVIGVSSRTAALSGHGSLTVVPNDGLHGTVEARSPSLEHGTGHGQLHVAVEQIYPIHTPNLTGRGSLAAATGFQIYHVTANLTGNGLLANAGVYHGSLRGSGQLAATGFARYPIAAQLTGGSILYTGPNDGLHAVVFTRPVRAEQGTGQGTLSVQVMQVYRPTAALAGSGVLAATGYVVMFSAANLAGSGVLSATARLSKLAVPAGLAGHGALSGNVYSRFASTPKAHGRGQLTAFIKQSYPITSNLAGRGSLSGATMQRYQVTATLTGSGLFVNAGVYPSLLTGAGQLGASGYARYPVAANLAGGAILYTGPNDGLHAVVFTRPVRAEQGTGQGTLAVSAFARYASAPHPTGHGAVTAATKQIYKVTAHPTGHGSLTAAKKQVYKVNANLTGHGGLSAISEAEYVRYGMLTGHGALAATARMYRVAAPAVLTGQGALAGTTYAKYARPANLTGNGSLSVTSYAVMLATANLAGSGALSAATRMYRIAIPANLTGHGALTGATWPKFTVTASLHGRGRLTTLLKQVYPINTPNLAGDGELSAATLQIYAVTANLSGSGVMTQNTVYQVNLTGVGQLGASGYARVPVAAHLYGSGGAAAAPNDGLHGSVYPKPAALEQGTGRGTLGVTTKQIYRITPTPHGVGTLAASAHMYQIREAAALIGHGTLVGSAIGRYLRAAGLTGHGALSAIAHQIANVNGTLPGHGALSAAAIARYLQSAAAAGHGVLAATATKLMPSLDAVAAGNASSSSPASLATSLTIAGNCVIAAVGMFAGQTATCKVGTTAMTSLGVLGDNNSTSNGAIQLFYLQGTSVPTGAQNVTASWSSHPSYAMIQAMSFKNVHAVSTLQSTYGYTSNAFAGVARTTIAGGIVVGAMGGYSVGNPPLSGPTFTSEYNNHLGSYFQLLMGYAVATTTSFNFGATTSGNGTNYSVEVLSLT